jgi:anti-sigma factor RsiW
MKPDCPERSQVSAFADGELGREAAARMAAHISLCNHCRELLRAYQSVDRLIGDLPEISVSASFESGVSESFEKLAEDSTWRESLKHLLSGWRPVWAFAVAVCLVAGVFLYERLDNRAPSTEEVVIVENLELFQDFELIQKLELLQAWDHIEAEPS